MTNSDLAALVRNALAQKTATKKAPAPARQDAAQADAAAALRAIGWSEKKIKDALAAKGIETVDTTKVTYGEYQGNRMINLQYNDGRPFSFGRSKARMIVAAYEHVKRFAEAQD